MTAVWSPAAAVQGFLPVALGDRWAYHLSVFGSALYYVQASYTELEELEPALEVSATQRAVVALNVFQAALGELRAAGLPIIAVQALHRTYANGAVAHLRGQLQDTDWRDLWV